MSGMKKLPSKPLSALISMVLLVGGSILPVPEASAAELCNADGVYLCEAFNIAGGSFYNEPRSQWINFLDKYSSSDYYIGTPYDEWLYSASPRGDKWQLEEGYSSYIISGGGSAELGGMNSNGFIWHAVAKSLSEGSGKDMSVTGKCVPMLSGFNTDLFSRPCWQGGNNRWSDFIGQYSVKYYEFDSKLEMLSSGVLGKGDIIWCVDSSVGSCMSGLSIPADNHHVGIYMGSGYDDLWWQTGPTKGDGDTSAMFNSINPIYGCASSNTYVVLPWDGVHTNTETPITTAAAPTTQQPVTTTTAAYHSRSTRTETEGLKNPEGKYFNDGIRAASGGRYSMSLAHWQSFITKYTSDNYYVDTPYSTWLYAASPNGDKWQFDEGCKEQIISTGGNEEDGGLNCMAFVWHALSLGLAEANNTSIDVVCPYIPFNDEFNTLFSRKAWSGYGGWLSFIDVYDLRYYEFDTKEEMLGSGALRKGDIIWCVDGNFGTGLSGLKTLSDNHHIGIYAGDGSSDLWWQSGPTLGNNNFDQQKNSVNPIYGCAVKNTYVVIPFGDEIVREPITTAVTTAVTTTTTTTTTTTQTQQISYSCGDIDNDSRINAVDASMVLTYYAMISTNKNGNLSEPQKKAADVDKNGVINAVDASNILTYYAYTSTSKDNTKSLEEYMKT